MSRLQSRFPLLLAVLLGFPSLAAAQAVVQSQTPAASQSEKPSGAHKSHSRKSTKPEEPPLPPYVATPLSPLPLEDMPAIPPQILFQDRQLTIVSENSTLVDILREVRKQTGADFEIPSGATERVVTAIGPGPARDVLATLLNGTHFNYVMVGSTSDPTVLERVVLTPKPTPGTEVAAANDPGARPARAGFNSGPARRFGASQPIVSPDDDDADPDMAADQSDDTDSQPDQQPPAAAAPGAPDSTTPSSSNTVNTPQGPKTPEQLLQELQQRIDLRRQPQEQQNKSSQPWTQPPPQQPAPTTFPPDQ
jgi:hypothetical protein